MQMLPYGGIDRKGKKGLSGNECSGGIDYIWWRMGSVAQVFFWNVLPRVIENGDLELWL